MQLKNKRILLTGASGGIGYPLALMLARKGANLALVGRDPTRLEALANEILQKGGHAVAIVADLAENGAAARVVSETNEKLGGIDVLINNAGILDFILLENQTPARVEQMIHTNVTTLIHLTQAVLPQFKVSHAGHIVMIGSILGSLGFPFYATYCASKFAVHGFSQALRRELIDTGIGVTYVAPRGVHTPINDANTLAMLAKTGGNLDEPNKVAALIVKAIEQEKEEMFIGQPESFFAWLNGIAPKIVNIGLKKQARLARAFAARSSA